MAQPLYNCLISTRRRRRRSRSFSPPGGEFPKPCMRPFSVCRPRSLGRPLYNPWAKVGCAMPASSSPGSRAPRLISRWRRGRCGLRG